MAARMQRVATQQPPRRQPHSGQQAVTVQRLYRVVRARRVKPAAAGRPEKQGQQRRNAKLVNPHRGYHCLTRQAPDHPPQSQDGAVRSSSGVTAGLTVRRQFCGGFSEIVCRVPRSRRWAGSGAPRSPHRSRVGARAGGGGRVRAGHACSGCGPQPRRQRAKRRPPAGPAERRRAGRPRGETSQRRNAGRLRGRYRNRRCAGRAASLGDGDGPAGRQTTVRRLRPLRRREASTLRPPRVAIRARNPILRTRFFLCGR